MNGSGDAPALAPKSPASPAEGAPPVDTVRAVQQRLHAGRLARGHVDGRAGGSPPLAAQLGPRRSSASSTSPTPWPRTRSSSSVFGIDTYIQKELPARPGHSPPTSWAACWSIRIVGERRHLRRVGVAPLTPAGVRRRWCARSSCSGCAQVVSLTAATLATILYASQTVGRLAVLNVASKLLWAAGVGVALYEHASIEWFAVAFFISEGLRLVVPVSDHRARR